MRVVIATVGSLGDLFPFLAIGQVLRERGHEVRVATHAMHREAIEAAGLGFIDASGMPEPEDRKAWMARAFHPVRGPRFVVRDLAANDAAPSYERLAAALGTRPVACSRDEHPAPAPDGTVATVDVIVTTTLAFAGQIVGETGVQTWLSAILAPAGFLSAYEPPATGVAWLDRLFQGSPARGAWLGRLARRVTRPWTEPVRRLRRSLGLPEEGPGGDPFHTGQHARDGVLALFPVMFGAPQPDWPANSVSCGFARYRQSVAVDRALEAFLDEGDAPIVFTLGSAAVFAGESFLRESIVAATRLGLRAVVLTGSPDMRQALGPLPPAMIAVDYASHAWLFPRASIVVHHGGVGTSAEALHAGVPMLVVPHGFDQPDNAARLRRLGVAEVIPARRYRARRVVPLLRRLVVDTGYRARAKACRVELEAGDGARAAADVIEAAMRGSKAIEPRIDQKP